MKQQFLHENWEMRQIGNDEFLPAAVPGSVYGDLLSNGKMENPFWKDNENDACELMEEDYEYVSHFDCEDGLLDSDRVVLRFDGIDTVGDVYLNEIHLGSPLSMHRVWEYDVKEILHDEALQIRAEDVEVCRKIGEFGLELVKPGDGILTHCNAGQLATVKYGTATAPIYLAVLSGSLAMEGA